MPRDPVAITINDLSTFSKSLRLSLQQTDALPSHAAFLSLVAKAAGYKNFQHLKADTPEKAPFDHKALDRALRVFDQGVMQRWPKQTKIQGLCLWAFWAALPARTDLTEKQINAAMNTRHSFGDPALLRRSLIDHRMATRTIDGKTYRRIEQAPPAEGLALIQAVQRPS